MKVRILPPRSISSGNKRKKGGEEVPVGCAATCGFGLNAIVILIANVAELGKAHPSQLATIDDLHHSAG